MSAPTPPEGPLIIAHRGASGYLPEHTLEAKALAFGMGAHFLEQDVVASADDELVVLHDIELEHVTDVAGRFPDRRRGDGHWYARDFRLSELRTLEVRERRRATGIAVYPARFPTGLGRFRIATLAEELEMIEGLRKSTGRFIGIYPEIKVPAWHLSEGVDLSRLVLRVLDAHGYRQKSDPAFLQCFDARELRRIRQELGSALTLVQLIGTSHDPVTGTDYERLRTAAGLREAAEYADGIGPWLGQLYSLANIDGHPISSGLASAAHDEGLVVHPYTFRADDIPPGFAGFAEVVRWFADTLQVDGMFTDFPDLVRQALQHCRTRSSKI